MQINTPKNTKAGTAITQFLQFLHFEVYTFRFTLLNSKDFAARLRLLLYSTRSVVFLTIFDDEEPAFFQIFAVWQPVSNLLFTVKRLNS